MISKKKPSKKTGKSVFKKMKHVTDMDQPIVTCPLIDKLSVVINVLDKELIGQIGHELLCMVETGEEGYKKMAGSSRYPLSVMMTCPDVDGVFSPDNEAVLIQVTNKEFPTPQVRLEFNPDKLPMNGLKPDAYEATYDYLETHFTGIFGMGFFDLLAHGHVTRIDICRNILFRSPDDYLFRVKGKSSSQTFTGKNGGVSTINFGARSGSQVKIYNKSKQLHGQKYPDDSIRIERTFRPKEKTRIHDLWNLPNQFKGIEVFSLYVAGNTPLGPAHMAAFQDSCRYRSIAKAIARQPKSYQHKLRKYIANRPVNWWEMPDDVWFERWHEALLDAWLNHVPDKAPGLTLKALTGNVC